MIFENASANCEVKRVWDVTVGGYVFKLYTQEKTALALNGMILDRDYYLAHRGFIELNEKRSEAGLPELIHV